MCGRGFWFAAVAAAIAASAVASAVAAAAVAPTTISTTITAAFSAAVAASTVAASALTTALTAAALAAAVSTVRFHHGKRRRVLQWVRAVTRERQPGVHVQRRHQGWEALLSRHDRA